MADDARISTAFPRHPKTVKVQRRLGLAGCWSLLCLFLWAADNRPDGDLKGMTAEDIEIAANWEGESGTFLQTLTDVRFLDGDPGSYSIHDWKEHNPWAAGRPERIAAAKKAAKARWQSPDDQQGDGAVCMQGACDPHVSAMPTSPPLTITPDTTTPNPLPSENQFSHSKERQQFSQSDFDARDLRKFHDARKTIELKFANGWGSNLTDDQIFEHQCALAGVHPKQMQQVLARTKVAS